MTMNTRCTVFFPGVCLSCPAPAALSGVFASASQSESPSETEDTSPLNFDPLKGLRQRDAAPLLNVWSGPEICGEKKLKLWLVFYASIHVKMINTKSSTTVFI